MSLQLIRQAAQIKNVSSSSNYYFSSEDLKPNETKMTVENLSKQMTSHPFAAARLLELNTNNHFLSGHPAIRAIIIQSYGAPGEPGATQRIEPHDAKMMMFFAISQAKKYSVGYLALPESFPNQLQTAQTMIDSFQIISKQ